MGHVLDVNKSTVKTVVRIPAGVQHVKKTGSFKRQEVNMPVINLDVDRPVVKFVRPVNIHVINAKLAGLYHLIMFVLEVAKKKAVKIVLEIQRYVMMKL
jgi:hypothetical protein